MKISDLELLLASKSLFQRDSSLRPGLNNTFHFFVHCKNCHRLQFKEKKSSNSAGPLDGEDLSLATRYLWVPNQNSMENKKKNYVILAENNAADRERL